MVLTGMLVGSAHPTV